MKYKVPEFLTNEKKIRPALLGSEAMEIARELEGSGATTHQVRKFYDEVKKYQKRLKDTPAAYPEIKPLILMLKSKAQYAALKQPKKMNVFSDFIRESISKVVTNEDTYDKIEIERFNAFCLFFEAVYGYANLKDN